MLRLESCGVHDLSLKWRLKLVIDPSGKVTSCEIASSDLKNAELESKIVALVRGFNFGADEVGVWNGKYPLNFYPQ